jgi:hypothetical protein
VNHQRIEKNPARVRLLHDIGLVRLRRHLRRLAQEQIDEGAAS